MKWNLLYQNYSCLQNPWLGGYRPQIPALSVLNWICWTPPQQNSCVSQSPYRLHRPLNATLAHPNSCPLTVRTLSMGRDSSVGIATRYGLDGPGIESRWEARFSAPFQTGPGAYPASSTTGTGSIPGLKRPGRGVEHPLPSSAEVK